MSGAGLTIQSPAGRRRKRWRLPSMIVFALVLIAGGLLYLNSESFHERVRRKVIAELELMTGGRVEVQSIRWRLLHLDFVIEGLTIHGGEAPSDAPYVHAERLAASVRFSSLFSREVGLRSLRISHPVLHLIVRPDGSTNQPRPAGSLHLGGEPTQEIFDLAVDHIEADGGELLLNERRLAFGLQGQQLSMGLTYLQQERAYDGHVSIRSLAFRYADQPPLLGDLDAAVRLQPSQANIRSLKVKMNASQLEASGTLKNYSQPDLQLKYSALFDLHDLARFGLPRELVAGRIDATGNLAYNSSRYAVNGTAAARGLEWRDGRIHVAGMNGTAAFSVDPKEIELKRVAATLLGGTVQGDATVTDWAPATRVAVPQKGRVRLKIDRVQLAQLASAISGPGMPLNRIRVAGAVTGNLDTAWTRSPANANTQALLDINPPEKLSEAEMPVTAHIRAAFHASSRTIDLAALDLATRAIRVDATGTLGSRSSQARISVNASDLQELHQVLAAFGPGTRLPITVGGHASFTGGISGTLDSASARGRLEMRDFETLRGDTDQAGRIHWDSLVADVNGNPQLLEVQNGLLRRGEAQAAVTASVSLQGSQFSPSRSRIAITAKIQNADLSDVQDFVGEKYPVAGIVTLNFRGTGVLENMRGSGDVQLRKLAIYGEPFRGFQADFNVSGQQLQFSHAVLSHNGAQISGSAGYDLKSGKFNFDLSGTNFSLADFARFELRQVSMAGTADFHASGSGTRAAPVVNGTLHVRNLVLSGEPAGDLAATGQTQGENLVIHASSNFQNSNMNIEGTVRLRDQLDSKFSARFDHLDIDAFIRGYTQLRTTGHSLIAGTVQLEGPLKRPHELKITGGIDDLAAEVETVKVRNSGPIQFSVANWILRLQEAHLVGDNTDLNARGTLQLGADHSINLRSDGHVNLKLLQTLDPELVAYGMANFDFRVNGTPASPLMTGQLSIENGGASFVDLPNGLSQINGTMVFAQDRVQIQKLTALTGGGLLQLGGFLAYRNGLYFDLTAAGKDVRLRYPPGVSASADANLRFTGSTRSSLLSGDITVTRFATNQRFDFGYYLAKTKLQGSTSLNPLLDNIRLDIHVLTTPELNVETSVAKVTGDADLHIRGTASRPAVLGRVNLAEGDVSFNGTKYHLERGDITFTNPLQIDPVVNVEMSARVRDYDVTIGLHGPLRGQLTSTFRSDPPLPSSDIPLLLAFGRTREDDLYSNNQPGQSSSDTYSNAFLGQALNSAFSDRVQRIFGASRVKIDPQFIGSENNPSARVTIEQQFSNNITFTYITNLTQSAQTVIQMEYNVNRNVSIVAVRDQNGVVGFDVQIRQRKK